MLFRQGHRGLASRLLRQRPWPRSSAIAQRLDPSQVYEEERLPRYDSSDFYPATLGEILNGRYQLATKLGWGGCSTVWLARDLKRWRWMKDKYVAIKINSSGPRLLRDPAESELPILKHISSIKSVHKGSSFVRKLVDNFTIEGPVHKHVCLVFHPLREPLALYRRRWVRGGIPPGLLKLILQMTLLGLEFLHSECRVVHGDIKPNNVMVRLEDLSLLDRDVRREYQDPLPQKSTDNRTIYLSRENYGQISDRTGLIQITDFSCSALGEGPHTGRIGAPVYQAPEIILDSEYTYSADIWSLGVMAWDLLEKDELFEPTYPLEGGEYNYLTHLAQITALLGLPPKDFIDNSKGLNQSHEPNEPLKGSAPGGPGLVPDNFSFESKLKQLSGEQKEMFIKFLQRMLKWNPKERSTAKELFDDPWLHSEFPED